MTRLEMLKKELLDETAKQKMITDAFGMEFADPDLTSRCIRLDADIKSLEAEAIKSEKAFALINDIMSTAGLQFLPEEKVWISGKYPRGWDFNRSDTLRMSVETQGSYATATIAAVWDPNNDLNGCVGKNILAFSLDDNCTYNLKPSGIDYLLKNIAGENPEFRKAELKWMIAQIEKALKQQGYKPTTITEES